MRMSFFSFGKLFDWRHAVCALGVAVLWGFVPAQAQTSTAQNFKGTPHDEVQKSLVQRNWTNAMWQIDAYLENQPRDPQMRFWRARLLQQLERHDEAFDVYVQLSQDYPELPEVQNNLGVMLAARGKIDEAQQAFVQALRNNPSYAIAHENLGDVLLHLAKQSFLKSQETGGNASSLAMKLSALQPVLQLTLTSP
jgi:Tfp pilus assembly protein PilF